ncbi:hypothetical protein JNM87_00530 [Candidatus Saccharibacteria bacterium]|nr:hypothetical protein [Candidatus Saccharibacteria bacterium]
MQPYWYKQAEKPLFPDLLWARPEMKSAAGKLLIVGGHAQSFALVAEAYSAAQAAGIGVARVLLPASLERTVGRLFPAAEYAPSNPSGGFATSALAELLALAQWSDGVLLAGDLGRNSETHAMLENFAGNYTGQLTITKDIADFFCTQPTAIRERPDTTLVVSMGQLQKLAVSLRTPYAFTSEVGVLQLVELLHSFTSDHYHMAIITRLHNQLFVTAASKVSTTQTRSDSAVWRTSTAAGAATWWLQNPHKQFEALTSSVYTSNNL